MRKPVPEYDFVQAERRIMAFMNGAEHMRRWVAAHAPEPLVLVVLPPGSGPVLMSVAEHAELCAEIASDMRLDEVMNLHDQLEQAEEERAMDEDQEDDCPVCGGDGSCPSCGGDGRDGDEDCPECDGSGECPECG